MALSNEFIREIIEKGIPFVHRAGLKIITMSPNHVKVMLPKKGNENHVGTIYAGALFTLAEIPGGVLFYTTFDGEKFFPIIKEMTIKYKKPATTDVTTEIFMDKYTSDGLAAEAEQNGKADFVLECEIMDAHDQVVAVGHGVYQMRKYG
jgi:thioesterase domain-containing protein